MIYVCTFDNDLITEDEVVKISSFIYFPQLKKKNSLLFSTIMIYVAWKRCPFPVLESKSKIYGSFQTLHFKIFITFLKKEKRIKFVFPF